MKKLFLSILAIVSFIIVSCGGTETKKTGTDSNAVEASSEESRQLRQ